MKFKIIKQANFRLPVIPFRLSIYSGFILGVAIIVLLFISGLPAQKLPDQTGQYVNDYVGWLSKQEIGSLNKMLRAYEDTTSNQFLVAIFPDAQGYAVEEFAIRLAEKWRAGKKERDNGVLMAIFRDERAIRIEVGYGLEDVIPDAIAFQIAQSLIPPYFKKGDYYQGIYQGLQALIEAAAGKYQGVPGDQSEGRYNWMPLIVIVILLILFSRWKKYSGGSSGGWRNSGPFFGGFGGGFGGSPRSGGGFGGFRGGGGSFGGGGATGRW